MLQTHQVEELISAVSGLDHGELVQRLRAYRATFPLDFTREFLEKQSVDRLRHLFVAVCLQQQRLPQLDSSRVA